MTDWSAWSRESAVMMSKRTQDLIARNKLGPDSDYHWSIDDATMTIGPLKLRIVVIGTVSNDTDTFLWSWANETIPDQAKAGMERVFEFGKENQLGLLTEPVHDGGKATGQECLGIAGRILEGDGIWIDSTKNGFIFFVMFQTA
jgi:hypothetical protein